MSAESVTVTPVGAERDAESSAHPESEVTMTATQRSGRLFLTNMGQFTGGDVRPAAVSISSVALWGGLSTRRHPEPRTDPGRHRDSYLRPGIACRRT